MWGNERVIAIAVLIESSNSDSDTPIPPQPPLQSRSAHQIFCNRHTSSIYFFDAPLILNQSCLEFIYICEILNQHTSIRKSIKQLTNQSPDRNEKIKCDVARHGLVVVVVTAQRCIGRGTQDGSTYCRFLSNK